jgi:argininosuccinate lyase
MATRTITAEEAKEILQKLNSIQSDVNTIKLELAETRGAYRLAKFVIALLGVSGLGGLTAWFAGQGK